MATVIGHSAAALVIARTFQCKKMRMLVVMMAVFLSILPDFDVITFHIGIPYSSMWGHRGLSHSVAFAVVAAFLAALLFGAIVGFFTKKFWILFFIFFTVLFSHICLDAITDGGLGVALWAPFSSDRYFLPWRPLPVSPISISRIMQARGLGVLKYELYYIAAPSLMYVIIISLIGRIISKIKNRSNKEINILDDARVVEASDEV